LRKASEALSELPRPTGDKKRARIKHHLEALTGTPQKKISGERNLKVSIGTV